LSAIVVVPCSVRRVDGEPLDVPETREPGVRVSPLELVSDGVADDELVDAAGVLVVLDRSLMAKLLRVLEVLGS